MLMPYTNIWADSYDTPCDRCGATPCYTLYDKEALCDQCAEAVEELLPHRRTHHDSNPAPSPDSNDY